MELEYTQPQQSEHTPKPEDLSTRVKSLRDEIVRMAKEKGGEDAYFEVWDEIGAYGKLIKERHSDSYQDVKAYHALLDSGTNKSTPQEDFPGEDSVIAFLENLKKKYL